MGRRRKDRHEQVARQSAALLPSSRGSRRPALLISGALVVIAAGAAFLNTLTSPFVFDDRWAVLENPTIHALWPLSRVLSPPGGGSPVQARPLVNLSLAVNYALGGTAVFGYHLFNLIVHVLAAWTLMAVVRRTLAGSEPCRPLSGSAVGLATAIGVIWTVHPLVTEPVCYVTQRTESMVGLFYLLTLYLVIRGAQSASPMPWFRLAVLACALGMACKEVMVTAPVVVLAYDAIFLSGSVREALRRRRGLYLGLAATWAVLGYILSTNGLARGTSAGFGGGMTPWRYLLTQCWAILHYLRLCVVPYPLVVDYGSWTAHSVREIVPGAVVVLALLSATVAALLRGRALGFLGVWFFAILAPTSSFVPLRAQTLAEKRMYLPLAAVVVAVVVGAFLAWRRLTVAPAEGDGERAPRRWPVPAATVTAVVLVLGLVSRERGRDYRDAVTLWRQTVAEVPLNPRAHNNLGMALLETGQVTEALGQFRAAVAASPGYAAANANAALALERLNRLAEAVPYMSAAVESEPGNEEFEKGLVRLLARLGRWDEALSVSSSYLDRSPGAAGSNLLYGSVLRRMGRTAEALPYLQRARRLSGSGGADSEQGP